MREATYRDQLQALDVEPVLCNRIHSRYPKAMAHFEGLCGHEVFKPDVEPYLQGLQR